MQDLTSRPEARFYFGPYEEDHKAYIKLLEADFPCRLIGLPLDAPTPMLIVEGERYIGLVSIEKYLSRVIMAGFLR